jgi:hypothetical protein
MLQPTFALSIGRLSTTTSNAVAGPRTFLVERDMDVAADGLQVQLMERADVDLDDEVELRLGHDGEVERVFVGNVVQLRPTLAGVMVIALGKMHHLLKLRMAAFFENQSAGSIVHAVIGQTEGDAGTVDDGPTLPRFAVDSRLSGYAHLKALADRLGFELYANRDGAIMFQALGDAAALDALGGGLLGAATSAAGALAAGILGGGSVAYQFGQHLVQTIATRVRPAWGTVAVGGESPMSGQGDRTAHWLTVNDRDYRGEAGTAAPSCLVLDPVARTKDLANRFAAGRLAVAKRTAHQVTMTVLRSSQVDLGQTISVRDTPDALMNGSGYVRAIRHRFGVANGFVTDLRISLKV